MAPRNGGIMPCTNEACRYPTRTFRAKVTDYPFPTRSRRGGLCHVCYYAALPKDAAKDRKVIADPPNPATQAAHDTYLAARRTRELKNARRAYSIATNPRSTR